jgi:hypothetical protein
MIPPPIAVAPIPGRTQPVTRSERVRSRAYFKPVRSSGGEHARNATEVRLMGLDSGAGGVVVSNMLLLLQGWVCYGTGSPATSLPAVLPCVLHKESRTLVPTHCVSLSPPPNRLVDEDLLASKRPTLSSQQEEISDQLREVLNTTSQIHCSSK